MGSCVSKKAARAGAGGKSKVAAPLPVAEKERARALPPVAEAVDEEQEEEVKEVVLSETPEPVKRRQQPEADDEEESEACSASDGSASVESSTKEKTKAKLLHKQDGAEKKAAAADEPRKERRTAAPPPGEKEGGKGKGGGAAGNARARSPSSAQRRQHQHPPARPRREQPAVVSGIGCRSGRFSPSAARRAAESAAAVRRTHSAREADMALPSSSKRSLTTAINGLSRRDAGERSSRRSDSPTGRRAPASPMRKAAKEHGTPERGRTRGRHGDEQPEVAGAAGGERKKLEEGALGQNPSVAMECFIFL